MKFESYNEIFKQGESLLKTLNYMKEKETQLIEFFKKEQPKEIIFLACGSSYWLSLSAAMTFQKQTGINCHALKSGEVVLDSDYYKSIFKKPLLITPSRSGTTEETIKAINFFKSNYNCNVLAITEYENSPIEKMANLTLFIPWANEISVCQTRSFNNMYFASIYLAALLSKNNQLANNLENFIKKVDSLSKDINEKVEKIINDFTDYNYLVVLGSGVQYGVAIEGAYINIEMAQQTANYYSLLEFRHGPIVMLKKSSLVAIFCRSADSGHERQMANEIKKRNSKVLTIKDINKTNFGDYNFDLGYEVEDELIALYGIFVLQAFAYHTAVKKGLDPDNPADLVRFITLEDE